MLNQEEQGSVRFKKVINLENASFNLGHRQTYRLEQLTKPRVVCHSPVSDVVTTGEVEMLQSVKVRRRLCHSVIADLWTVAECQTGEAAAVPGYRQQAGVSDLWQHGERQALEVWVAHHLGKEMNNINSNISSF